MIEVDGSVYSGSGTLLRYAVALATILGESLHMIRIRARRDKPGLRPQHLQALKSCCALSGGRLEGAEVGSQEIRYQPGNSLRHGDYRWDIGTAGSTSMLAFTLIPIALYAKGPCRFFITGGLFQDFAPSAFHLQKVLIPLLVRMGGEVKLKILRPGYVPMGQGQLELEIHPMSGPLTPLEMTEQGKMKEICGISLASHLEKEKVSERMASQCQKLLAARGFTARIEIQKDQTACQRGAALFLRAESDQGCLLGADQSGRPGRRSEAIAEYVVNSLFQDLETKATADRHLADQLILFAALAAGLTQYRIPMVTDHIEANLWLAGKVLGVRSELQGNRLRIEGIGRARNG